MDVVLTVLTVVLIVSVGMTLLVTSVKAAADAEAVVSKRYKYLPRYYGAPKTRALYPVYRLAFSTAYWLYITPWSNHKRPKTEEEAAAAYSEWLHGGKTDA